MPTLLGRPTIVLACTLAFCPSACSTVYSSLAFDEVEEQSAGRVDEVEVLPAQVDVEMGEIEIEVRSCESGCERGGEEEDSSSSEPDSTQDGSSNTPEQGDSTSESGATDNDEGRPRQKIDYLFVVDNSGSMKEEQEALAASASGFIASIQERLNMAVDVHAGVILTGEINPFSRNFGSECETIGSFLRETDGPDSSRKQCYPDGQPKYSTGDSDLATELDCALRAGTGGSGDERPMDALLGALSPKMVESPVCNEGFFRDDAMLVITLLTDEEDDRTLVGESHEGSKGNPKDWTRRLIELRGGNKESVVVLGLIGTEDSACDPLIGPTEHPTDVGAQISKRLETFVQSFGEQGLVGDICAPRYDGYFRKAAGTVYQAVLRARR